MNQSASTYTNLLLGGNFINVEDLEYGYGPISTLVVVTDICEVNEDDKDSEDEVGDEDGDDENDGDEMFKLMDIVPSFLTINQLMENEQGICLSMDVPCCDVSNNPYPEDPDERGTINYYLAQSPQFENMKNFGNVVLSNWTPWLNYNTANSSEEFVVGQVFCNVLKTGPVTESEKLPGHDSLVGPVVEPCLNRWRNKYIIYILKYIINNI